MLRELAVYQQDVLDSIDAITSFCRDLSFEQYQNSLLVRSAVERQFEIIGEAMRQMEQFFPGSLDQISDTAKAKGLRNRLAHGYFYIDQGLLWDVVQEDLSKLRADMVALMAGDSPA